MQRVDLQRLLKGLDGFGVLLLLAVKRAEKIVGVGIGGIDLQHLLEVIDRLGGIAGAAMDQSEVVPDPRIARVLGGSFCIASSASGSRC